MKILVACMFVYLAATFSIAIAADNLDNKDALRGVKEAKIYFDVYAAEPKGLLTRFLLLNKTYEQLEQLGIATKIIIGFRGKATRLVTLPAKKYFEPSEDTAEKIQRWIKNFKELGFTLEQCALAAELQGVGTSDFIPEISLVANGYVSMIGYQMQGYAVVPLD